VKAIWLPGRRRKDLPGLEEYSHIPGRLVSSPSDRSEDKTRGRRRGASRNNLIPVPRRRIAERHLPALPRLPKDAEVAQNIGYCGLEIFRIAQEPFSVDNPGHLT